MGIVLLINILLFILTLRYFHKIFNWLFQKKRAKRYYQASAVVLILLNCASFLFDLIIIAISYDIIIISTTKKASLVFKLSSTILIPVLEFMWISFNVYRRYHTQKGNCKIFLQSTGLCQILWFAHRLLIEVTLSLIFFIIAPAQTVGMITLLFFTILCAIIFIAQLFNMKCHCDTKTVLSVVYISITGTVTVTLVLMITLLFITLVDNGLQSSGMGGFILSIIPPLIALIIGVYVNRNTLDSFFKWTKPTSSEPNSTQNDWATTIQNDGSKPEVGSKATITDRNSNESTHLL